MYYPGVAESSLHCGFLSNRGSKGNKSGMGFTTVRKVKDDGENQYVTTT